MSVILCQRDASVNEGGVRIESDKIVWHYTQLWFVQCSDPNDGVATILQQGPTASPDQLPEIGDFYQTANEAQVGAICCEIDPRQEPDMPTMWRVTCTFSTDILLQQTAIDGNPLHKPTVITYATRASKRVVERGWLITDDGDEIAQPIANVLGEKFDPPDEEDVYHLVVTVRKNVLNFPVDANTYIGRVNSVTYGVWDPYEALMTRFEGEPVEDNSFVYYRQTVEFEIKTGGWTVWKLNQGSYSLDEFGNRVENVGGNGLALSAPVLLDLGGVKLPDTWNAGSAITPGANVTITPADMTNIKVGDSIVLDPDNALATEIVTVLSVSSTTFNADVLQDHAEDCTIQGEPVYLEFLIKKTTDFSALDIF